MDTITINSEADWNNLPSEFESEINIVVKCNIDQIRSTPRNAIVYVSGSANIGYVSGSANIGSVYGSANIGYVSGSANIGYVSGSANIGSVSGSANIGYVSGSANIGSVSGSVNIGSVSDSANIGSVSDSANIGYVYGSANIGYVYGSANIVYVSDSANIGYAGDYSVVHVHGPDVSVGLIGFAVAFLHAKSKSKKIARKSKTATIIEVNKSKDLKSWIDREGLEENRKSIVVFKRVSKHFKTQENTKNETAWLPGSTIEHPNWSPESGECGEGKYHACSAPPFCDSFRSVDGDRYIAIRVCLEDLYFWKDAQYPKKIAFRKGKVLHECDIFGEKIVNEN